MKKPARSAAESDPSGIENRAPSTDGLAEASADRAFVRLGGPAFSVLLFLLCLALCIWKLPRGTAITDEALYLTIPYRFLQGDTPLLHEWHVTQLAGLLLLPLLRLRLLITGSTEGILLAFRGIYLLLHGLTALYICARLRRFSRPGALFAALMFLVYSPMNIATLSYNSMGIDLLAIVFVTLACCRGKTWEAILCGLCFAGAVLCNPYFFLLYPLYTLAVLCLSRRRAAPCLSGRFWLRFTAAATLLALLAAWRILRHAELSLLRETIPAILSGDTAEHPARSLPGILYGVWASFHKNALFVPTLAVSALMCLCIFPDKRRSEHAPLYLTIAALLSIAYALWFRVYANTVMNYYMFPVNIVGFFAWLLSERRRNGLFFLVWLPGLLCWFCSAAASNLGFLNIASLSTLNMLASVCFVFDALEPLRKRRGRARLSAALLLLSVLVPFALLLECKACTVYPMRPVSASSERIEHGALRGLYAEPEEKTAYEDAWEAVAPVREEAAGHVAYLTDTPGLYLSDSKRCGAFSAWFPGVSVRDNLPRLLEYWELFPDRVPERIVVGMEDPAATELLLEGLTAYGFRETPLESGFWLLER